LGLTRLRAFLKKHKRVALDTSIFIYQLEANPAYVELTAEIFRWLETPQHSAVTSSITMTELLVHPYRAGNIPLVNQYFALLSLLPRLEWVAPDLMIADTAAQLRAVHNLRTPDAILAATTISKGATGILTNDPVFQRIPQVDTGVLDRLR
jgi:predicted nucleic acid-binding protein